MSIYNQAMAHVIVRLMHALIEKKAEGSRAFIEAANWMNEHMGEGKIGEISDALRKGYPTESREFYEAIKSASEVYQNIYLAGKTKPATATTATTATKPVACAPPKDKTITASITDAEEFKAWLEFKALKTGGLL